jgi:hypothetical protein
MVTRKARRSGCESLRDERFAPSELQTESAVDVALPGPLQAQQARNVFGKRGHRHRPLARTRICRPNSAKRADTRVSKSGEKRRVTGLYEIRVFKHVFTKAVEWGILDRHPFKGEVRLRGLKARDGYVEDWEIAQALERVAMSALYETRLESQSLNLVA